MLSQNVHYCYLLIWPPSCPLQKSLALPTPPMYLAPLIPTGLSIFSSHQSKGNRDGYRVSRLQLPEARQGWETAIGIHNQPQCTFSHRNCNLNGGWLPSAIGFIVQPSSQLNRLLWTGLGNFPPFVTLFPWEKCFPTSKQLTYKQTFGTKCNGKLAKACRLFQSHSRAGDFTLRCQQGLGLLSIPKGSHWAH